MNCIICLEDDTNLIYPKFCSCKILLHEESLNKCVKYKIYCPICRIKKLIIIHKNNNTNIIEKFGENIFNNFMSNPNLINFLIFFVMSIFYSVFYIAPIALFYFIREKYFY